MKVHHYMQFYSGANSPGPQTPISLARALFNRGHQVSVISGNYNLNTNVREEEVREENDRGGQLRIFRLPSVKGGRGSLFQRLRSYVAFMVAAAWRGLALERPDVILGSVQPLFTGLAALFVARLRRAPLVLEVRDLWPDALEVKGAVTGWKAVPLHWIANCLYRNAARIVTLTPGIQRELLAKGISGSKIDLFPNGFDPNLFNIPEGTRAAVRERYGWGNDFVAIYVGSFTEVTAMEVAVKAAARLQDRRDIRFELFGQGPTREQVAGLAGNLRLENMHFHEPVPKRQVPGLLAAADVAIMCLFKSPLVHIYFENKFMDYLGAGKPILAAMEGEQARLIRLYNAGRVVPTFDAEGLAGLIAEAADSYGPFAEMGENGRKFIHENLLLGKILDRYIVTLEAAARNQAGSLPPWSPFREVPGGIAAGPAALPMTPPLQA